MVFPLLYRNFFLFNSRISLWLFGKPKYREEKKCVLWAPIFVNRRINECLALFGKHYACYTGSHNSRISHINFKLEIQKEREKKTRKETATETRIDEQ